jgi:hypothetical protein
MDHDDTGLELGARAAMILGCTNKPLTRCPLHGDLPLVLAGRYRTYAVGDLMQLKAVRVARAKRGRPTNGEVTAPTLLSAAEIASFTNAGTRSFDPGAAESGDEDTLHLRAAR